MPGISDKKKLQVHKMLKTMTPEQVSKKLGIALVTVGRYNRLAKEILPSEKKPKKEVSSKEKLLGKLAVKFSEGDLELLLKTNTSSRALPVSRLSFEGKEVTFGVLSDTHIGSKYFRDADLNSALKEMEKEGCLFILHAGDVVEGMSNRPGQIYELTDVGYSAQVDHAVKAFAKTDIPVHYILGNHCSWLNTKSGVGVDLSELIQSKSKNMRFLGYHEGTLIVNGAKFMLYHGEDGSCFDDKTEILTETGWKFFSDLKKGERVATMTKEDHTFQWQVPTEITEQAYSGQMIHFKSRSVDLMVTPNHGMWTRVSNATTYRRLAEHQYPTKAHCRLNTQWHRKEARELLSDYSRQKWQFTRTCEGWDGQNPDFVEIPYRESKNTGKKIVHGGKVKFEDMAELMAWYVTEGTIPKDCTYVRISQYASANPEFHERICGLASRFPYNYKADDKGVTIYSVELAEYLVSQCGRLSSSVHLPLWLKDSKSSVLRLVFKTMIAGDGWDNGKGYGYRSISKTLLDDVDEISQKLGYTCTMNQDGQCLSICDHQTLPTVNTKPESVFYEGNIHCVSVPNGLIYVRRNGRAIWTHNSYATSYRVQKVIEMLAGGEKPNALFLGHTHKSIYLFERNIHAISAGCIERQSAFMRGKKLSAHTGFWICKATIANKQIKKLTSTWYPIYQ